MDKWMRKYPKSDGSSHGVGNPEKTDPEKTALSAQEEKEEEARKKKLREKQFEERFQNKSVQILAIFIILLSTNEIWIFITKFTYSVFTIGRWAKADIF